MTEVDFEKLGVFYLGKDVDPVSKKTSENLCLYESRDMVTHGLCIGMTGSGKTGLCLALIEEAAIDNIPVIAIDPKGDIGNLLLTFPQLRGEDFEPWVDADQAKRVGKTVSEFAAEQAQQWKDGLADWHESGDRIAMLKSAADFAIYTPGSSAGLQVSIIKSFEAPPQTIQDDEDAFHDHISATVSSLLGLLKIEADPLKSREHILVSNILRDSWTQKKDLSLAALIQLIQKPPFSQIGALDLEAFYPAKERFTLAMSLNNLLASPGFSAWTQGEPLNIDKLLYTEDGKARVSIFSIAHLSDSERMFFVSLLLNQLVAWMRAQSGTTSLRAIFYMDEIFGYFPPVSAPPSKAPLLTLLKQGRAFGLGVLLASQNPVDIDYKGLGNAGTWFIGRLQTERDKMRVLDGLEGAASEAGSKFDRKSMDTLLSSLGGRVFLMNNVHADKPSVFKTRWTLSYLRGPLSKDQIKRLMADRKQNKSADASPKETKPTPSAAARSSNCSAAEAPADAAASVHATSVSSASSIQPIVPPGVTQYYLPVRQVAAPSEHIAYKPALLGIGNVRFADTKAGVDTTLQYALLWQANGAIDIIDWSKAGSAKVWTEDLKREPEANASFAPIPAGLSDPKSHTKWSKDFATWLYNNKRLNLFKSDLDGMYSKPREAERDFRIRLTQTARELRDEAANELKNKFAPKLANLQERLRRAEQALQAEEAEARERQMQAALSVGTTVLGALMGRRAISSTTINRAGTAARSMSRSARQQQDVEYASDNVSSVSQQLDALNQQFSMEMQTLDKKFDPLTAQLETVSIAPKKTNVSIEVFALAWAPYLVSNGEERPAWLRQ